MIVWCTLRAAPVAPSEHTMSKENIIVAAQPEAAEAGAKVLMQGGND